VRLPATLRTAVLITATVSLIAAGCSEDDEPETTSDPAEFAAQELESGASDSTTTTTTTTEPDGDTSPTDIPGAILNRFQLGLGDCFEQTEQVVDGVRDMIFSTFPCDEPHHFEVYDTFTHPAEHPSVYPGESVMRDYAIQLCYRTFPDWVGQEYELSELEIDVLVPTRANFEEAASRYRGILCWVERLDGEPMVGSSRGSGW
jgi:hypothetical protein